MWNRESELAEVSEHVKRARAKPVGNARVELPEEVATMREQIDE